MIALETFGTWTPLSNGSCTDTDIKSIEDAVGAHLPDELKAVLLRSGSGNLVIEEPREDPGVSICTYCPQLRIFHTSSIRSWLDNSVKQYMKNCLPFASDAGPTLFVWKHDEGTWEDIYTVPAGDLGWQQATKCGRSVEQLLMRWAAHRDERRVSRKRRPRTLNMDSLGETWTTSLSLSASEAGTLRSVFCPSAPLSVLLSRVRTEPTFLSEQSYESFVRLRAQLPVSLHSTIEFRPK